MKKRMFILIAAGICIAVAGFVRLRERAFPRKYRFLVELTAKKYHFDPLWIASIVHIESSFNPGAVSSSGACGLMQVMPETAGEIMAKNNYIVHSDSDIFLPSLNIELGCWYLAHLQNVFKDTELALIAYNAGRGNVKKWLDKNPNKNALECIEFPETEEYVLRVKRMYMFLCVIDKIWPYYGKNESDGNLK